MLPSTTERKLLAVAASYSAMTYRVTFRKRFNREGEGADAPNEFVNLPEGVVIDSSFSESTEPDSLHSEERMEEDDDFESLGTEVWEYEVADGREQEFIKALENSRMVLDYVDIDDVAPV
jgi:hypothetical protein